MARIVKTQKQVTRVFNLELLAQAITETWATDATTPGLVCSFLPYESADQQFYVSVVRYDQPFGKGKRVVFSAKASSFDAAARVAEIVLTVARPS